MALLLACIAAIYALSDKRASPNVTEHDHAKKSPAIRAVVVAEIINAMFWSVIIVVSRGMCQAVSAA